METNLYFEGSILLMLGIQIRQNFQINSLGANSARIVLATGHKWSKTSYSDLEKIISWCENDGLICVLEVHDFTGSDDPNDIISLAVNYWSEMKNLLNEHQNYVIVNIANEWLR